MNGRAEATLPVSILRRSTALNFPRPPLAITWAAVCAGTKSASAGERRPAGTERLE